MKNKLQNYFESIAYIGKSDILEDEGGIYYSRVDDSYLTRVGLEDSLEYLLDLGVTEQIQATSKKSKVASIGFNPEEQKWYGWSHRAIFGFGIDSKVKEGDCSFKPSSKESFTQDCLRFWGDLDMDGDTYKTNPISKEEVQEGKLGIYVEYVYNNEVPNVSMRGQKSGMFSEYPEQWGRGAWEAKTLDDAKEMAIDFARGVS